MPRAPKAFELRLERLGYPLERIAVGVDRGNLRVERILWRHGWRRRRRCYVRGERDQPLREYLTDVLLGVQTHPASTIDDLLPDRRSPADA